MGVSWVLYIDKMRVLSRFDAFSKAEDHVQLRTLGGGIVSILAMGIMVYLVISEFMYYGHIERDSHVLVYNARDSSDITVSVDIELMAIKCDEAKIQIQNKRGDHSDLDLKKVPAGEAGCRLSGSFPIPRIAGIFQISSKPLAQNSNFFFSMLGLAENVSGRRSVVVFVWYMYLIVVHLVPFCSGLFADAACCVVDDLPR